MCYARLLSHVRLCATPWTVAHQAPLSVGFSGQEYWSGLPFPSPILYIFFCNELFFGSHCKWYLSILFQVTLCSIHSIVWLHYNLIFSHGNGYLGSCPCFCYHKLCCNNHSSTVSRTQVQECSGTIPHGGKCRLTGYEHFTITTFPQLSCQMWPPSASPTKCSHSHCLRSFCQAF